MGAKHDALLILLTFLVLIVALVTFFGLGTYVASTDENGGFEAILTRYETKLSPPSWAYYIWFLVGLWQVAWILYVLTTICRYTESGPLYRQPPVISKLFMWAFLVALLLNCVAFLFLIIDQLLMFIIFMLLLWFTLALTMVYLHLRMDEYWVLMGLKYRRDLCMLVVGAQNGVAAYATCVAVFLFTGVCSLVANSPGISATGVVIAAIVILLILMTSYFLLDVTMLDRHTRFTFVPYPLIFWVLVSVIHHRWHPIHGPVNTLLLVAALVVILMFIIKVAVISGRKYKGVKDTKWQPAAVNGNPAELQGMKPLEEAMSVGGVPLTPTKDDTSNVGETASCGEASPCEETSLVRRTSNGKASPCKEIAPYTQTETPDDKPDQNMFTSNITIMKDVFLVNTSEAHFKTHEYTFILGEAD